MVVVLGGGWIEEVVVVWKGEIDFWGGGLPKVERLGSEAGLFQDPSRYMFMAVVYISLVQTRNDAVSYLFLCCCH